MFPPLCHCSVLPLCLSPVWCMKAFFSPVLFLFFLHPFYSVSSELSLHSAFNFNCTIRFSSFGFLLICLFTFLQICCLISTFLNIFLFTEGDSAILLTPFKFTFYCFCFVFLNFIFNLAFLCLHAYPSGSSFHPVF